ncbi:MAG TPA: NusG domain II-containing protein [Ruminiclostridium sp.]
MKFFKKTDLLVVLAIVLISIISLVIYNNIFSDKPAKAVIYYKSELVETVALNTGIDKTFSISQNKHVVFHLYKDGSISFEESDCPDKVCIKAGKLNSIGETSACLPNEIILKIVPLKNRNNDDLDMIVGK